MTAALRPIPLASHSEDTWPLTPLWRSIRVFCASSHSPWPSIWRSTCTPTQSKNHSLATSLAAAEPSDKPVSCRFTSAATKTSYLTSSESSATMTSLLRGPSPCSHPKRFPFQFLGHRPSHPQNSNTTSSAAHLSLEMTTELWVIDRLCQIRTRSTLRSSRTPTVCGWSQMLPSLFSCPTSKYRYLCRTDIQVHLLIYSLEQQRPKTKLQKPWPIKDQSPQWARDSRVKFW